MFHLKLFDLIFDLYLFTYSTSLRLTTPERVVISAENYRELVNS